MTRGLPVTTLTDAMNPTARIPDRVPRDAPGAREIGFTLPER